MRASAKYNNKALVSNWWDDPFAKGAFTSPAVGVMTTWWGAQSVTEGNMYFAGEA
ncbi:MAG: FAD-dependent oxidoreductase [Gammaproteobacteria bacterium]|nr:FAD-dependent oxidoreductase [Gammaproteobacteria bacterium]